jgi:excisionase family DNA binding protein
MSRRAQPPQVAPLLRTAADAATLLGLTRDQIYRLVQAGHLTAVRIPSRTGHGDGPLRIEQQAIDAFIDSNRIDAGRGAA